MKKQVVATGVIVGGVSTGIFPNRQTGEPGKPPEVEHIKPGTIFVVEDETLYKKLKRMRVISDYTPETGNPAARLNAFFGSESPEAGRMTDLEAQQAEEKARREAEDMRRIEEAKARARAEAGGRTDTGGNDGDTGSGAQSQGEETPASAKAKTTGKAKTAGKSKADSDDDDDASGMV